jgi:hypothetical protein
VSDLITLPHVELMPVLKLIPFDFATRERPHPGGSERVEPGAWSRYWSDCLADSGIRGLEPLYECSCHVPVRSINAANLRRILAMTFGDWGGIEALRDPELIPCLNGGLALYSNGDLLVEPNCCTDLRNWVDWRQAVDYRGTDWQMLWIGHPWLSVRYEDPWLILSGPHESDDPVPRGRVTPDRLGRAVTAAIAELESFSRTIAPQLIELGCEDVPNLARQLAGFANREPDSNSSPTCSGV